MRITRGLKISAILLVTVASTLWASCGNDSPVTGNTPRSTNTAAAPSASAPTDSSPSSTPTGTLPSATLPASQPAATGVAAVDAAIKAVLANDVSALRSQFAFYKVNCAIEPARGFPVPPKCAEDEADGTPVDVYLSLHGEGAYARPADVDRSLSAWLANGMHLYAVIQWPVPNASSGNVQYTIVFKAPDGAGPRLWLSDAGIVAVVFDPAKSVRSAALLGAGQTYLVAPPAP